jgi:hypothetical protein
MRRVCTLRADETDWFSQVRVTSNELYDINRFLKDRQSHGTKAQRKDTFLCRDSLEVDDALRKMFEDLRPSHGKIRQTSAKMRWAGKDCEDLLSNQDAKDFGVRL